MIETLTIATAVMMLTTAVITWTNIRLYTEILKIGHIKNIGKSQEF